MNPTDELSSYYAELLEGTYDCVDRVVLNAYFPMRQTGGGLRTWWRQSPFLTRDTVAWPFGTTSQAARMSNRS